MQTVIDDSCLCFPRPYDCDGSASEYSFATDA
jgi:hypothetical protein